VSEGGTIQLYGGPDGMASYSWTGPGGWTSTLQNPIIMGATAVMAGTYTLTVTNNNGCTDEANISVTVSTTTKCVECFRLTISSTEGGSVTTPREGVVECFPGIVIDLVASPDAGYKFVNWSGDVATIADVNDASTTITMWYHYTITANFELDEDWYSLTVSSTMGGSVTTPGEGTFPYVEGSVVNLVASPDDGYEFVNWTGDSVTHPDSATTTITMNGDYSITANFEETPPSPAYPTVITKAATDITINSVTLNMNYTMGDLSQVEVRFAYKKSTDLAWSYTAWVSKTADGTHAEVLTGLDSDTEYDFKAQLRGSTTVEGTTLQFNTDTPPSVGGVCGCFIATAAYGTPTAEQIDVLREFRDVVLLESTVGSQFVALYYLSPPVADFIAGNELLRTMVRELLVDPIVWVVKATGAIWRN